LNTIDRIRWDSLAQLTAKISLNADTALFGPKLISARSFLVASLLFIGARSSPRG
jgi:hypothetical protein